MAARNVSPNSNGNSDSGGENNAFIDQLKIQHLRNKTQKLKDEILNNLDSQLEDLLEDFCQEVEESNTHGSSHTNGEVKKTSSRDRELPDKVFVSRRSVLTELFEISHIQTLKNIFIAVLIIFSMNTILADFIEKGGTGSLSDAWQKHGFRLVIDLNLVYWAFGKLSIVVQIWVGMMFSTLLVYPCLYFWAISRPLGRAGLPDWLMLVAYIVYQIAFMAYPIKMLGEHQFPFASAFIVLLEQTRLVMKSHAFVRENAARALRYKPHSEQDQGPCPDFSCYLYFLFAPTLVYRDTYPRTNKIRWSYVVSNFAQVFGCTIYIYYVFYRFCVPIFQNFNSDHVTPKRMVIGIFGCTLPGVLILFIGFFALLHSWLNAFAEMLRFGDRLFYKDWWNSSHFSNYYRTWNVVVHDWLYCYVYKDIYNISHKNQTLAMSSVFFISAVFHEYILMMAFGFFYPILFIMFGTMGFGLMFVPKGSKNGRVLNIMMWVCLFLGMGILMCLYSMEWFARRNCSITTDSFLDYLIPRTWTCDVVL